MLWPHDKALRGVWVEIEVTLLVGVVIRELCLCWSRDNPYHGPLRSKLTAVMFSKTTVDCVLADNSVDSRRQFTISEIVVKLLYHK